MKNSEGRLRTQLHLHTGSQSVWKFLYKPEQLNLSSTHPGGRVCRSPDRVAQIRKASACYGGVLSVHLSLQPALTLMHGMVP